jgi:hypothetical protein
MWSFFEKIGKFFWKEGIKKTGPDGPDNLLDFYDGPSAGFAVLSPGQKLPAS